jgi:heme exporter protein C
VVSAVFNIFAAFDIPLVYFSIWFFRTQHPQPVIGAGGSLDPRMLDVLLLCWGATLALLALLLPQRYRLEALRYEAERLRLESENRVPEPRGIPAVNPKERPA